MEQLLCGKLDSSYLHNHCHCRHEPRKLEILFPPWLAPATRYTAAVLDTELILAAEADSKWLMVVLHGLGDSMEGFRWLHRALKNPKLNTLLVNAPEDYYQISELLRDNERYGIESITSRTYPDQDAVAISAQRLHNIAGTYTGKDDPIAVVRNQGIFPAPEELVSPFAKAHYIGGDARGSHVMPLMPVPLNTAVTGPYCLPLVSCLGFSLTAKGEFSDSFIDFFDNPAWDYVRQLAQRKAIEMRSQGWSGAAMLPYGELEYSGFRQSIGDLVERFTFRDANGAHPAVPEKATAADD